MKTPVPTAPLFLVVSSDAELRELLCESIDLSCGSAIGAGSVRDALLEIEEHPVDAIISDCKLKDGSGLDLIRRVKGCGLRIPSAIMIGRDPDLSEIVALAEGADTVFQKPFGITDFIEGLRNLAAENLLPTGPGRSRPTQESPQWANRVVLDR